LATTTVAAEAAGTEAAMDAATDYSVLYASGSAIDVAKNSDQISGSDDWRAFGLIAGYNAFAAVQAGFGSDYTEERVDRFVGSKDNMLSGALSDGLGGAIHDAGNTFLQGYNSQLGSKWSGSWRAVYGDALAGVAKAGFSKIVGNGFDKLGDTFSDKDFGKYSLMMPKQIIGGLGGQLIANFVKRTHFDQDFDGPDNWENMGASWGRDYWKFLKDF